MIHGGLSRFYVVTVIGLSLVSAQVAVGPVTSYTPAAMAAGAPDGVGFLSPNEAVNLFSGNLSFTVPLYKVSGRGNAGYSMVLPIGTKWNIENHSVSKTDPQTFVAMPSTYPYDMLWPGLAPNRYSPGAILLRDTRVQDSK